MRFEIRMGQRREIERSRNCGERAPSLLRLVTDVENCCLRRKLVECLLRSDGWVLVGNSTAGADLEVVERLLSVVGLESFGLSALEEGSSPREHMLVHLVLQPAYPVDLLLLEDVVELLPAALTWLSFDLQVHQSEQ